MGVGHESREEKPERANREPVWDPRVRRAPRAPGSPLMGRGPAFNRRAALKYGAATTGLAAVGGLSLLGDDLLSSLAEPRRPGDISDVEHVVVFTQENRSFDHYYGSLSGVRGFGDNATVEGVFAQPDIIGARMPFRVDTTQVDGQRLDSLDHSWDGVHKAWAGGVYNDWISANGALTMGYLTRADIPFHYALADAFTICDHNFCSVLGPTIPNRLYLFSGTIDPGGRFGGPVVSNPRAYEGRYRWTTYPERLQAAGVSWKVYANNESGQRQRRGRLRRRLRNQPAVGCSTVTTSR